MIRLSAQFIKNLLSNNLILKTSALALGCVIWFLLNQHQYKTTCLNIPICLYNEPVDSTIQMPETITVTLAGKLIDLALINPAQLAVHIDGSSLNQSTNIIMLNDTNLFLPEPIKLLHWSPLPLQICLTDKQESTACIT